MTRTVCLLIVIASCGSVKRPYSDDAAVPPTNDAQTDAPPDMPPPTPPTPGGEIVNGAGHLKGATFTFDVEIGHPVGQQPTTGPTYKFEANAAVKPEHL